MEAQLKDRWKFSFQLFGGWTLVDSGTFNTAQDFWGGMRHIPAASQLLTSAEGPREAFLGEGRDNVRAILLSRGPVVLEWKYPELYCIYQYEVQDSKGDDIDSTFEDHAVNLLGEEWPGVLGMRLLDRSKKGQCSHRWEFWCSREDESLDRLVVGEKNGKKEIISH